MDSVMPSGDSISTSAAGAALPAGIRPTPGPMGVVSFEGYADPLDFLGDMVNRFGDVTRYQTAFGPCLFFVHPRQVQEILHNENYRRPSLVKIMLGDGLLTSDGPRWRSQRRLMQRDFLPPSVAQFVEVFRQEAARTALDWRQAADTQQPFDITTSMTRLTLRIIMRALFSKDLTEARNTELCNAVTQAVEDVGKISSSIFGVPVKITADRNAKFAASKLIIDTTCLDLIQQRRAQSPGERAKDLLTMLMEADTPTGKMSDRELRDEMVTMMIAGHETTALTLAWAWKALADHPEIQQALHAELDRAGTSATQEVESLQKLPWTRAIMQETMRLYPPVWYLGRVAVGDDVVDGHFIPRGACILVSAWFTHRHAEFWKNPGQFDPRRFMDQAEPPSHRYAYFPFGGGRHQCIGMPFAQVETVILLAELARQFSVLPLNSEQVRPASGLTLRQMPGLLGQVRHRAGAAPTNFHNPGVL